MNTQKSLKLIAKQAMIDPRFVRSRGMCMKFVRQVVQTKYGEKYDRFFFLGTAHHTAKRFQEDGDFVVRGSAEPNDLLFWFGTHGQPEGHAAILGDRGIIYENSTLHKGGITGGKGTRQLAAMRKPSLIVRLW